MSRKSLFANEPSFVYKQALSVSLISLDGVMWSNLMRLGQGQARVMTARVEGFHDGKVVLRVQDKTLLAESEVPLKVGQELRLQVLGQQEGRVWVRPVATPGAQNVNLPDPVAEALAALNLPQSDTTEAAVLTLLRASLPVTPRAVQQVMTYLEQGGDPSALAQVFHDAKLLENLPPALMAALGRLWKKPVPGETPFAESAHLPAEDQLLLHLTPDLRAKAAALLSGLAPEELAQELAQASPEARQKIAGQLVDSALRQALLPAENGPDTAVLAALLRQTGDAAAWAEQARHVLSQWQHQPLQLALPSPDPAEKNPVQVEVNAAAGESGDIELVFSFSLSGLGDVQARLKTGKGAGGVKALLRAREGQALAALRQGLE